ncbi:MAG: transglutaminase family protein [Gemmatimonadales bacterium]
MPSRQLQLDKYLRPTPSIDCDDPAVADFAEQTAGGGETEVSKAVALFEAVRDGIRYDPYRVDLSLEAMRASAVLARKFAFCIPKATLLAACARVVGIPSRLGFADVKNHLATERLKREMQTDVFTFHAYTELFLEGKWLKATPAFNSSLCERFNVAPLDFDGRDDALLQQFDREGNRYMEYLTDHGQFADLPLDKITAAFEQHYPSLMSGGAYGIDGQFEQDAVV